MEFIAQHNLDLILVVVGVALCVRFFRYVPTRKELESLEASIEKLESRNNSEFKDWNESNEKVICEIKNAIESMCKSIETVNQRVSFVEGHVGVRSR